MRTGVIAQKVGMTQKWRENGNNIAVTMLYLDTVTVTAVRREDEVCKNGQKGYNAVQLGAGDVKDKHISKALRQSFAKSNVKSRRKLKEFRVSQDCLLKVGDVISADHFVVGQMVDVTGVSQGKGFAGAMKRHGFHGLRATHGVSVSHRSHGSTGQCQDPGKVFKGKKMAGHMGAKQITGQNLEIIETDEEKGIILVKGNVPGPKGGWVSVCDAVKQALPEKAVFPAKLIEQKNDGADDQNPPPASSDEVASDNNASDQPKA